MREKTIVSAFTLAASLVSYFYAKQYEKDAVPYVMIGGYIGAMLGEALSAALDKKQEGKQKNGDLGQIKETKKENEK